MARLGFLRPFATALLAAACGCETIERAQTAQEEVAPFAAEPAAVAAGEADDAEDAPATNAVPRVRLVGCRLPEFVAFAFTNRPDVAEAAFALESARLGLVTAEAQEWPQIDLTGGYSQSTANNTRHFSWRNSGRATAGVALDWTLVDFGRMEAQEQEAREKIVAAERDLANVKLAVFKEVALAYFGLLRDDALLAVAATNELQYADHLRQAEILLDAGETKNLDVLKARLDLSDARLNTITASNDVTTASAEFLRALGLTTDAASREDLLAAATNAFADARRELAVTHYTSADALGQARDTSPSLMALRARIRAASSRVDYAVADLMPSLSLSSAFSFADPTWNWSWGFAAVQSLFQGFRKTTAVDAAVVEMRSAAAALLTAEQTLAHDLAVAVATRDTAAQALETARVQVEQAKENYDNVVEQYKVGEASRIDFTDAASAFAAAQGARVKAFYAGQIAEAALVYLTGLDALYE